jgi:hypothetical protein
MSLLFTPFFSRSLELYFVSSFTSRWSFAFSFSYSKFKSVPGLFILFATALTPSSTLSANLHYFHARFQRHIHSCYLIFLIMY